MPVDEFLSRVAEDLPDLMKHDFLSRFQAIFFNKIKESVTEKEIVVILDYAENYSCEIQNAI